MSMVSSNFSTPSLRSTPSTPLSSDDTLCSESCATNTSPDALMLCARAGTVSYHTLC